MLMNDGAQRVRMVAAARAAVPDPDTRAVLDRIVEYQGEQGMRAVRFEKIGKMRDGKDAVWMMCDNPECCGKLDPDDQRFLMQIPTPHAAAGRGLKSRELMNRTESIGRSMGSSYTAFSYFVQRLTIKRSHKHAQPTV